MAIDTGKNIGTGIGIYSGVINEDGKDKLLFKTLVSGAGVVLTEGESTIVISADQVDTTGFLKNNMSFIPMEDKAYDIGSTLNRYQDIYAETLHGTAILSDNLTIVGNDGDILAYDSSSNRWIATELQHPTIPPSQTLSVNGNTLSISDGNSVDLPLQNIPTNYIKTDGHSAPTQNMAFDIGSSLFRYNDIYAQTFQGVAVLADNLTIQGDPGDVLMYTGSHWIAGSASGGTGGGFLAHNTIAVGNENNAIESYTELTFDGSELKVDTTGGIWTNSLHNDPYYGGDAANPDKIKDHQININGFKINPLPEAGWNSSLDPAGDLYQRPDRWPGAIIYDFEGSKIAENQHENAKIVMAPALNGTIGIPMITWYYRDDGAEVNPVSLPTEELANEYNHPNGTYRAFWSTEISGTAAAIQPYGRNGSVFEWFWDQDNVPFGRISTVVGANDRGSRIEFGSGGGGSVNPGLLPNDPSTHPYGPDESAYEPDFWISRDEANLVTIKVNNKLTQRMNDESLVLLDDTKLVFENSAGGWATIYSENAPGNNMRLRLDGDVVVTGDLVNNAGVSAFDAGGGLETYDITDFNTVDLTTTGVGFPLNNTNGPGSTAYGQTLTLVGNGDTALQISSGFDNDNLHFRAGNPKNATGAWGNWYQVASRAYVDTAIAGATGTDLSNYYTKPEVDALITPHFSGSYNDLTDTPVIFDGQYTSLTGTPTIPSDVSELTDTTNLLDHFSGDYNDLINTPTIPDLTGYALETYVDTAISNLVNGADAAFDTLKEIQDAMATDAELATAISNLSIPSDVSDLTDTTNLLDHFSGSYNDLTDTPVLFSGSYNDLTDTPTLATVATTGDYNDLINLPNIGGAQSLQDVTDLGATTTNKVALADGITLDATNLSYTVQPAINKVDYFDRNMVIMDPLDPNYDEEQPWNVSDPFNAGMKTNTINWGYQSLTGEPHLATQQIMGVISDQGARNGKFIIGNVSMVGGIGEPVWTIGYVDEGDDHGGAQNMYKKGDGTNTGGMLQKDFKPILSLEPSGTIASVRGKNTTALADPDKVSHNAGSFFEGFFDGDIKPAFRIQGLNDPLNPGSGGGLIEFGPAGGRETDFHISRWTRDQVNIRENNQNFMNWVNNPTWRRGLVMENGTATYWIGEGSKVTEVFTATAGQQTFTIAQDLTGDYSVKDVIVNGMFLRDNIWSMNGQDITIPTFEDSPGKGVTIEANDEVRIIITDSNKNREISARNLWNVADSRSELTVTGGIIRVSDLVNNAGVSAFGGGGMEVTTLNDANDANPSEPSVAWNFGTTNWPTGVQYGQTLTVTGDGDTAFQVTSGFGNDSVYFRSGNPESPTGGWNDWYRFASREWVNAQGFSTSGPNMLIQDLTDADVVNFAKPSVGFNLGTANFPAGTQYGQTLTVTGNGDTQWQMTSGFNDDQIWFRTGNPEKPTTGTWKNWIQIASRNYVDTAIAALPSGSVWTEDLNATVNATVGSKTFVDTSTQVVTVVLPATPTMGDEVRVIDANGNAATNNITVDGNGENIMGSASNLIVDRDGAGFTLVYYNSTRGWVLAEN